MTSPLDSLKSLPLRDQVRELYYTHRKTVDQIRLRHSFLDPDSGYAPRYSADDILEMVQNPPTPAPLPARASAVHPSLPRQNPTGAARADHLARDGRAPSLQSHLPPSPVATRSPAGERRSPSPLLPDSPRGLLDVRPFPGTPPDQALALIQAQIALADRQLALNNSILALRKLDLAGRHDGGSPAGSPRPTSARQGSSVSPIPSSFGSRGASPPRSPSTVEVDAIVAATLRRLSGSIPTPQIGRAHV